MITCFVSRMDARSWEEGPCGSLKTQQTAENTAQYVRINIYMRKLQFNWCYCSSPMLQYTHTHNESTPIIIIIIYFDSLIILIILFLLMDSRLLKNFLLSFMGMYTFHKIVGVSLIDRLVRTCCWWFVRLLENNWNLPFLSFPFSFFPFLF
jgi:hypothetical protein